MTAPKSGFKFACCMAGIGFVALIVSVAAVFAQSSNFPVEAGSLGGNVRSGPGIGNSRQDGLRKEERVTILQNTGKMLDGYPWFKISYRKGRIGFQWGGIVCARRVKVQGTRRHCPGFRARTREQQTPSSSLMTHYQCDDGTQLIARYETFQTSSTAIFSHDGYPEVKLRKVRSVSGMQYSNSNYNLHTQGKNVFLSWSKKQIFCWKK